MNELRASAKSDAAPRISIVINNYNYGRFISNALESAVRQDYPNVEVIAVDDGSTDDSREVIGRFPQVQPLFKENGGQTSCVRAALERITGELTIILDSDDMLQPDACSRIAAHWAPDVTLIQYKLERRLQDGTPVGFYPRGSFLTVGQREFALNWGYIPSAPTSGNAFATEHIRRIFAFNRDLDRGFCDGALVYTAPLFGRVVPIDVALGIYLIHGNNYSTSAGINLKSANGVLRVNLEHSVVLSRVCRQFGFSDKQRDDFISPYDWRNALYMMRGYGLDPFGGRLSRWRIAAKGIAAFLRHPDIPAFNRLKNIGALGAVAVGPPSFAQRLLPMRTGMPAPWQPPPPSF